MNLIERENAGQGIAFFNRLPTLGDRYPAQAQLRVQSPGLLEKVGLRSTGHQRFLYYSCLNENHCEVINL